MLSVISANTVTCWPGLFHSIWPGTGHQARSWTSQGAAPHTGASPTGVQVSDETLAAVPVTRHRFHGDWNCTLHPAQAGRTATVPGTARPRPSGGTQPRRHRTPRTIPD